MIDVTLTVEHCGLIVPRNTGITYWGECGEFFTEVFCEGYYLPVNVWDANRKFELFSHDLLRLLNYTPTQVVDCMREIDESLKNSEHDFLRNLQVDPEMLGESYSNWLYCKTHSEISVAGTLIQGRVLVVTPNITGMGLTNSWIA